MGLGIFASVARKFFEKNFSVMPCVGKKGIILDWTRFSEQLPTEDEINAWEKNYPRCNIGCVMGRASGIICLDIDDPRYFSFPEIPSSTVLRVGKKGVARFFRIPANCPDHLLESFSAPGFDFLASRRQAILPPSIHPETKKPYIWTSGSLLEDDVPVISVAQLTALHERLNSRKSAPGEGNTDKRQINGFGDKKIAAEVLPPGSPGRNNRLKEVVQAMLKRGVSIERATHEVWLTDLREHCTSEMAARLGISQDLEEAWSECAGRWKNLSRSELEREIGSHPSLHPLFLDPKESYTRGGRLGIEAARVFVESLARTEEKRGLVLVQNDAPLVIDITQPPENVLTEEPLTIKKGRRKKAHLDIPKAERPSGKLGEIYDECLRANKGIHNVHMLALGTAVSTMSALAQHRFLPAFGSNCSSSLFIQMAPSGVGKTTILNVGKRVLEACGFSPSQGWKSSADLQDELLTERNQVALIDEASSFFSIISQNKPHAVELQDTLTRLFTHPAIDGGRFTFATSKAAKKEGTKAYVISPGITMVLLTTTRGLVDTAMSSIGQRGFLARSHIFYQKREILTKEQLHAIQENLGPSQIGNLCHMARDFIDQNPIIFRNGEIITTEKNYRGALSITSSSRLSVNLDENGPRQFAIEPRMVEFTPEAIFLLDEENRGVMSSIDVLDDSGGAFESRFQEWASRLGYLNCLSREDGPPCVTAEDVHWGIGIARILLRDASELMNTIEMSASQRLEQLVIMCVKAGRNTDVLIKSSLRRHKFETRMITQAIDGLIDDGTLDFERVPGSRQRFLKIVKRGHISVG